MQSAMLTSDLQTADAAIATKPGSLLDMIVLTNGSANATLILYDNASAASGVVLAKIVVAGADLCGTKPLVLPVPYKNGIYADITGTGAAYIVYYQPGQKA